MFLSNNMTNRFKNNNLIHVVLCGGSGSRLWPLSRSNSPKQFLNFTGTKSPFKQTVDRIAKFAKKSKINYRNIFVTSEDLRYQVLDQIGKLKKFKVILEPAPKNTAPSLIMASLEAIKDCGDAILIVSPSDHVIKEANIFEKALKNALSLADMNNIVLFGIKPDRLKVGYGFIKKIGLRGIYEEFNVDNFIEKPPLNLTKKYTSNIDYFWNSGIIIMRASVCLAALEDLHPSILDSVTKAFKKNSKDNFFIRPNSKLFNKVSNISIDYALLELLPNSNFPLKVIPLDINWSDLGAWDSFWDLSKKDKNNNAIFGDVLANKTTNSLLYSSNRLIVASNVDNIVIIETADSILVINKNEAQEVKNVINILNSKSRKEEGLHSKTMRQWGWFNIIDQGPSFKVKRIQVKHGA
jgi:mannose-1-phosphate guanylyltransferase/mannose-6-phosphate isomerase